MLEGSVGPENFQKGVTDYLNSHKYGNAVTQDLLDKLQAIIDGQPLDLDITEFMKTWTVQMGYPILSVTSKGGNKFVFKQKRFLIDPEKKSKDTSPYG